jgi:hypothetical protein
MKRFFLIFSLVFTIFMGAFSQKKVDFDFIVFGGYNSSQLFSDFQNKEVLTDMWKHQFHIGVGGRLEMGKHAFIQVNGLYTRKGGINEFQYDTVNIDQHVDYQSIDVDLLLGGRLVSNDDFNLRLYVGPSLSFVPKRVMDVLQNSVPIANLHTNNTIVSAKIGVGIDIFFVTLDFGYEINATSIFYTDTFSTRNNTIYLTLGFKLF